MTDQQQVHLFVSEDGQAQLEVALEQETVWLSQAQMAELFGTKRPAITKHLSNIYKSGELDEQTTCSILEHMAEHGQRYRTKHYNLDAIISVGYRVNSMRATQFRQWATGVLKQNLIQGYTLNQKLIAKGEAMELFGKLRGDGLASALATSVNISTVELGCIDVAAA